MSRSWEIPRCPACTATLGGGYTLCRHCGDRLIRRLIGVRSLLAQLDITRAHLDQLTPISGRGGDAGLPFGQTAADAYRYLAATVTYWAADLAIARGRCAELPTAPAESAVWLAGRLNWLRRSGTAGVAYREISAACSRARRSIDRPTHRAAFPVGHCPEQIAPGVWCAGVIWAYVPDSAHAPAVLRCRNPHCQRHHEPWTAKEFRRAGIRIMRRGKDIH